MINAKIINQCGHSISMIVQYRNNRQYMIVLNNIIIIMVSYYF